MAAAVRELPCNEKVRQKPLQKEVPVDGLVTSRAYFANADKSNALPVVIGNVALLVRRAFFEASWGGNVVKVSRIC